MFGFATPHNRGVLFELTLKLYKMRNQTTTAPEATAQKSKLTIAFQDFNGVILAKISNLKDRETFAYGETKGQAQINALRNYRTKYQDI